MISRQSAFLLAPTHPAFQYRQYGATDIYADYPGNNKDAAKLRERSGKALVEGLFQYFIYYSGIRDLRQGGNCICFHDFKEKSQKIGRTVMVGHAGEGEQNRRLSILAINFIGHSAISQMTGSVNTSHFLSVLFHVKGGLPVIEELRYEGFTGTSQKNAACGVSYSQVDTSANSLTHITQSDTQVKTDWLADNVFRPHYYISNQPGVFNVHGLRLMTPGGIYDDNYWSQCLMDLHSDIEETKPVIPIEYLLNAVPDFSQSLQPQSPTP